MKTYRIPISKLSPCGQVVKIEAVVREILPRMAKFEFWHDSHLIGFIVCQVGYTEIFEASDFLIEGYFKSIEFEKSRKEAGVWN